MLEQPLQNLVLEIANYQENTKVFQANDKMNVNRVSFACSYGVLDVLCFCMHFQVTYDLEHIGAIPVGSVKSWVPSGAITIFSGKHTAADNFVCEYRLEC